MIVAITNKGGILRGARGHGTSARHFAGNGPAGLARTDRLPAGVPIWPVVTPGQTAGVRLDAYPGRLFEGSVLQVADEAEFPPSNIRTKDDRVCLVYAT